MPVRSYCEYDCPSFLRCRYRPIPANRQVPPRGIHRAAAKRQVAKKLLPWTDAVASNDMGAIQHSKVDEIHVPRVAEALILSADSSCCFSGHPPSLLGRLPGDPGPLADGCPAVSCSVRNFVTAFRIAWSTSSAKAMRPGSASMFSPARTAAALTIRGNAARYTSSSVLSRRSSGVRAFLTLVRRPPLSPGAWRGPGAPLHPWGSRLKPAKNQWFIYFPPSVRALDVR